MKSVLSRKTLIRLGYGSQADAFQSGREAAQMARGDINPDPGDFSLVMGSDSVAFNGFVEGARLVIGEKNLVGAPVPGVWCSEWTGHNNGIVFLLNSADLHLAIASAEHDPQHPLVNVTSLFTQFREIRGNKTNRFHHRGLWVFGTGPYEELKDLMPHIVAEAGPESWIVGFVPCDAGGLSLLCRNKSIHKGLIVVEVLTDKPWGLGSVGIGAFKEQPQIFGKATKSALLDALGQLRDTPPACAFLYLNFSPNTLSADNKNEIEQTARETLKSVPFVCVPTANHCIRRVNRSLTCENDSIAALMVPQ